MVQVTKTVLNRLILNYQNKTSGSNKWIIQFVSHQEVSEGRSEELISIIMIFKFFSVVQFKRSRHKVNYRKTMIHIKILHTNINDRQNAFFSEL